MNDKVSIIMPCYKAEKYIADTLNDILNQTYTNWELIAVSNGAGQEPQLKILKEFQQKDKKGRIKVISVEKGSCPGARNIGIKEATGEWITFSDSDDEITPQHLQLFMDKANVCEADIICGGVRIKRVSEGSDVLADLKFENDYLTKRQLLSFPSIILNSVWSKLFKNSFIQNSSLLFDEKWIQNDDAIYALEALLKADKVSWIPLCGYVWIWRDSKSLSSKYNAQKEDHKKAYEGLRCALMRQAGYTESEIAERIRKGKYIDGYFFVCNLFKKGSPLHFGEKRSAIKRYVFDDAEMRSAIASEDRTKHNLFLKIYDFALAFHSPTMMTIIFQAQYTLKYNFMPLYLKIAPRLRK